MERVTVLGASNAGYAIAAGLEVTRLKAYLKNAS
jgi:hypothetical protein